jgi:DNA adenine methylase
MYMAAEIETPAQEHGYEPAAQIKTTPFPYPGNKTRLAEWILQNTIDHETWVAPFGGAGGILFNKTPSRNEVLNDLNGDIITFYRVLRDQREELEEYLRLIPYSAEQYREWKEEWDKQWRPDDDVKHAAILYFLQRASFGADQTGFRAVASGRKNSSRQFFNSLDRLEDFSKRLEGVILHNCDYTEIIDKYADDKDTFIYLDPPYKNGSERYDTGRFSSWRFAEEVGRLSGDYNAYWMVSSVSVPLTIGCYPTIETDLAHQVNHIDGGSSTMTEKLTMNYLPDEVDIFSGEGENRSLTDFD